MVGAKHAQPSPIFNRYSTFMKDVEYILTVRAGDIRELYFQSEKYKELKIEFSKRIKYTFVFFCVMLLSIFGKIKEFNLYILLILFIIAFFVNVTKLAINYIELKNFLKEIEDWITKIIQYKSNKIIVNKFGIMYYQDDETTYYNFNELDKDNTYNNSELKCMHFATNSGETLLLPSKSFENDDYEILSNYLKELNVL